VVVTLTNVGPELLKSIAKVFGPGLLKLHLLDCGKTPLADLVPCSELEQLVIRGKNCLALNMEQQRATEEDALVVLPKLKIFRQPKK